MATPSQATRPKSRATVAMVADFHDTTAASSPTAAAPPSACATMTGRAATAAASRRARICARHQLTCRRQPRIRQRLLFEGRHRLGDLQDFEQTAHDAYVLAHRRIDGRGPLAAGDGGDQVGFVTAFSKAAHDTVSCNKLASRVRARKSSSFTLPVFTPSVRAISARDRPCVTPATTSRDCVAGAVERPAQLALHRKSPGRHVLTGQRPLAVVVGQRDFAHGPAVTVAHQVGRDAEQVIAAVVVVVEHGRRAEQTVVGVLQQSSACAARPGARKVRR